MAVDNRDKLEIVFGAVSGSVENARDWAARSDTLFVRSQDQVAIFTEKATGAKLTALEAFDAFGFELLAEAVDLGSAVITRDLNEPAATLRERREQLGLNYADLATATGLDRSEIERSENSRVRTPVRTLQRLCEVLALDERYIGFRHGAAGDGQLGVRLKSLHTSATRFSPRVVTTLAESAWVAATHFRIDAHLGFTTQLPKDFQPSTNYGNAASPAWKIGYSLAKRTREILGLTESSPVDNLRDLCCRLHIPVVQVLLPESVAGATIAAGDRRAIVVNTRGANSNVWVRRATIAHELGHLLWDPDEKLQRLRVDLYTDVNRSSWNATDYVEQRANAFSIAFLAPPLGVQGVFSSYDSHEDGLRAVMETFGISATAARFHIRNSIAPAPSFATIRKKAAEPSDEWNAREFFTADYFPIKSTPIPRRGEFAAAVVVAECNREISIDTAATYLRSSVPEYLSAKQGILDLFPAYLPYCRSNPPAIAQE